VVAFTTILARPASSIYRIRHSAISMTQLNHQLPHKNACQDHGTRSELRVSAAAAQTGLVERSYGDISNG
jgi:hypothetical protein